MPTVPTKTQPTVQQRGAPSQRITVQATPDHFGAGAARQLDRLGRDISGLGDTLNAAAVAQKKTDEDNAFKEAKLRYEKGLTTTLYGDGTPNNPGAYNQRGKAGVEASRAARKSLNDLRQEILDEHKGSAVGARLEIALGLSQEQTFRQVADFENREQRVYGQELSDANKKIYQDRAIRGRTDESIVGQSEAAIAVLVGEDAQRNGWSPEVQIVKEREAISSLHANIVTAAQREGDIAGAIEHFETYKGKIDAAVAAQLQESLDDAKVLSQAQAATDKIMGVPNITDGERLQAVRAIQDPEVRKEAEAMVARQLKQNSEAERRQVMQYKGEFLKAVRNGATVDQLKATRPDEMSYVEADSDAFKDLKAAEKAYITGNIYGDVSDPDVLQGYLVMPAHELARVSDEELQAKRARLTESDYAKVLTRVSAARAATDEQSESSQIYRDAEAWYERLSPANFGFRQREPSTKQIQQMRQVRGEINSYIYRYIQDNGKPPTQAELAARIRSQFIALESWVDDRTVSEEKAKKGTLGAFTWRDIDLDRDDQDPAYLDEVRAAITQRTGVPATDDQVKQIMWLEAQPSAAAAKQQRELIQQWTPRRPSASALKDAGIPTITPPPIVATSAQAPNRLQRELEIVQSIETGGIKNPDEAVSSAGARGRMQVMPHTSKDPGFGVRPAQDDSPEELARVGREYWAAMRKRYDTLEQAIAAYNWGPGNTDKWIAAGADPAKLPKETRDYIRKFRERLKQ